jgi:hypothetical protein
MKYRSIAAFTLAVTIGFLSACEDDKAEPEPTAEPTTLPSALAGQVVDMEVVLESGNAPYDVDQIAVFSFGDGSALEIDLNPVDNDGFEVNLMGFTKVGNDYIWEDQAAGLKYAMSLIGNDSIDEVNVFDLSDLLLNRWEPVEKGKVNLDLLINMFGQYTVTAVPQGTHNRGTVNISVNGSIDFDGGASFNASDYALITNRVAALGKVFVDVKPYPTEPYARFEIAVDASLPSIANSMIYYPNYPTTTGLVEVIF